MHPEVKKYAEAFEAKMNRAGRQIRLNENELRFLDQVFGPEFGFNFQGLTVQQPFIDYKGTHRSIDFHYESWPARVIVEADSLKYHVEGVTQQQYDDHLEKQNDLLLNGGWILIRFTANMIRKKPMACRRQLVQAVGKSLIMNQHRPAMDDHLLWRQRKSGILQQIGRGNLIKPSTLCAQFNISRNTATKWLKRMVSEGELDPVRRNRLVAGYALPGQATDRADLSTSSLPVKNNKKGASAPLNNDATA